MYGTKSPMAHEPAIMPVRTSVTRAISPRQRPEPLVLVTRTSGTGLCSGDIARVVDVSNGITVGSCALGEFVPYTGPRG